MKASFFAIEKAPAHKDRRHKCCGIKLLLRSRNQRLLNLCGAEDAVLIFQSLRFRIEIITQNRRFRKSFDKIAALVTKIDYVPCFFCASYPWQLRAMERVAGLQGTPKLNRRIRL
jgi:hypothetical protein